MTNSHAAPAADATTSKHDEQSQSPRPLLLNTLMILALGVGLSGWLLRYTGWFAAFGGLLTLSGVFSWLAVMVKIFPERAFNILQESVYRSLFAKQVTRAGALIMVGMLLLFSFVGAIRLQPLPEGRSRSFYVYRSGEPEPVIPTESLPDASLRIPVWTSFWNPSVFTIKVLGYPEKTVRIFPWESEAVYVPTSFYRRVVLVKPSLYTIQSVGDSGSLTINVDGRALARVGDYDGTAFWIGCTEDVRIPDRVVATMHAELLAAKEQLLRDLNSEAGNGRPGQATPEGNAIAATKQELFWESKWLYPISLDRKELSSAKEIALVFSKNEKTVTFRFSIQPLREPDEFVQLVDFGSLPPAIMTRPHHG